MTKTNRLPINFATGEPLPLRAQPGYYPGQSALAQKPYWDEATTQTVEKRLAPKPIRFFTADEAPIMQAILDVVLPQDDRDEAHRIPVLGLIDEKLHEKAFNGYIYEGTPEDDVTLRLGLHAVEALALHEYGQSFTSLTLPQQETLLLSVREGQPALWMCIDELPPKHFWSALIDNAVAAYYAHPYAWDEIGFGGPAYPRGYMRLTEGRPEPWEADEQRYAWRAPPDSVSDQLTPNESLYPQPRRPKT